MTEATYTAWDGKLYEWPPPQGWYEASDGRWWPEGYGPRPESEIETGAGPAVERGSVEGGAAEAAYTGSSYSSGPSTGSTSAAGSSWAPPGSDSSADAASPFLQPDDDNSVAGDLSTPAAAAAITGDHQPMTAWVAESADTPDADTGAEATVESVSTLQAGSGEWADGPTGAGLEESVESRDRDEDGEPGDSQFGTSGAAVAGVAAAGAAAAGLTDLAGQTEETGSELFNRLQTEAEAHRGEVTEQVSAEAEAAGDAAAEAVSDVVPDAVSDVVPDAVSGVSPDALSGVSPDAVSDVVPDAVSDVVPDAVSDVLPDAVSAADSFVDREPTTIEQPVVDSTGRSEFSARFGSSRPGFTNSAYDEPTYDEQAYDEAGYGRVATDEPAAGSIGDKGVHVDEGYEPQAYAAPEAVETQAGETSSYDAPSFIPGQAPPAHDAADYDPEATTDPGFGGEQSGGDFKAAPEQPAPGPPPGQASNFDYESPRAAVSPMDAPTPSMGSGRRIFYAVLGVLALAAAGVAGYLAFQLQNDSDDASTEGTEQGAVQPDAEAAIGSLANPHDPSAGIRIEYPDGAETQPWTLQLLSVESDGSDGEARLAMQIVNDKAQGQGQLADLRLALVDAGGNDLASTPSPCRAGDSLDLTSTVEAGQSVSGPVCWSVGGVLPDNALLAVESTKAQGRVHISLP